MNEREIEYYMINGRKFKTLREAVIYERAYRDVTGIFLEIRPIYKT